MTRNFSVGLRPNQKHIVKSRGANEEQKAAPPLPTHVIYFLLSPSGLQVVRGSCEMIFFVVVLFLFLVPAWRRISFLHFNQSKVPKLFGIRRLVTGFLCDIVHFLCGSPPKREQQTLSVTKCILSAEEKIKLYSPKKKKKKRTWSGKARQNKETHKYRTHTANTAEQFTMHLKNFLTASLGPAALVLLAAATSASAAPLHVDSQEQSLVQSKEGPLEARPPYVFNISSDASTFLLDNKPHRVLSAEFHYFRCPAAEWEERLLTIKASRAINTIATYVPWNFHCPDKAGECDFQGERDLRQFILLCQRHGFEVILRPGPYICAEWDFGGLPAWLLAEDPAAAIRSSDKRYLTYVEQWYGALLPPLRNLMSDRGGPIIMVQVENEYGSFTTTPDAKYLASLRDITRSHVGDSVLLYATDPRDSILRSVTGGVYQAIDFLYWGHKDRNVDNWWKQQKLAETVTNSLGEKSLRGPPMNGEFYPGWFSSWGDDHVYSHTTSYVTTMVDDMMVNTSTHSNMNFFMFFGGTNFGFWNGGLVTTSYDYGAPLNESGHPTEKFFALRDEVFPRISGLNTKPEHKNAVLPRIEPPTHYGTVRFGDGGEEEAVTLQRALRSLATNTLVNSPKPLPMETLGQSYGFISYEIPMPSPPRSKDDPDAFYMLNNVTVLARDYAMVFFDDDFIGHLITNQDGSGNTTISGLADGIELQNKIKNYKMRNERSNKVKRDVKCHSTLRIVVENTGRSNVPAVNQTWKGIREDIIFTFVNLNNRAAPMVQVASKAADMASLPMRYEEVKALWSDRLDMKDGENEKKPSAVCSSSSKKLASPNDPLSTGYFARGTIHVPKVKGSTLLDMRGHGKGFVFVNGHNVGRYWSSRGPQYSLYVPRSYLKEGENEIIVFEQARPFSTAKKLLAKDVPPITLSSENYNVRRDSDEGAARNRLGVV